MDPATILTLSEAGISILNLLIQEEPAIAADLSKLFSKGAVSQADLAAFRASLAAETYGEFVPASDLPASETGVNSTQG